MSCPAVPTTAALTSDRSIRMRLAHQRRDTRGVRGRHRGAGQHRAVVAAAAERRGDRVARGRDVRFQRRTAAALSETLYALQPSGFAEDSFTTALVASRLS